MNFVVGLTIACMLASPALCIECFRCNSTAHRECLEKLIRPTSLRPESCSDVFEARFCVKTTGIYNGEIGDQRFCSSRDLGDYCEYIQRDGDPREYRSCVYTCDSDGCNGAPPAALAAPLLAAALAWTALSLSGALV